MTRYSVKPRTRKYVKRYRYLSFARNFSNKYRKRLLNTRLDTLKTVLKNLVHKAAKATGEFIGSKITEKIVK